MHGAVNAEVGPHAIPIKGGLGEKLLARGRLREQGAHLRTGLDRDFSLAARDHQKHGRLPLGVAKRQMIERVARDTLDVLAIEGLDRQHDDAIGGFRVEAAQASFQIVAARRGKHGREVVDADLERRHVERR